ncbi:MAG TPA: serine/threonine-protein kinase [Usitatibacter sp.]|jgi:serine/threonine protein kinase|nr:serine/threonine-protein kinase [Usitatibacter sp.]
MSRESIGKYKILRELGRGATGRVYLAEDSFAQRKVAIKVAYPEALKSSEDGAFYRSMFLNEASLAGKLSHPHIVQIYDAVVEDEYSYIVMEYVEGGTLEKFCQPESLLEPREAAEMVFKCVRALAFAHAIGLTHRDIKPGNILHNEGTDIKIADFGAAISKVSDRTIIANVGSPAYMAPELVSAGAQASHLTDIYGLGVVMYYLLAGRLPFTGANTMSVIYQIVNTEPEPPSKHRAAVSGDLDEIVMKAMARDPAQRYQSWDEFGKELAEVWKKEHRAEEKREQTEAERFSLLRTLPFFKAFPENELWEVMRISKWAKFKPETVLIKEGDHGDSFFILAAGYVRVTRGKRTLSVLTAGDCFGEMSYLAQHKGGTHRSATVTTTSDCIVMKIRAEDLRDASDSCRRLFDARFLDTLVDRLESANKQLAVMS